MEEYDTTTIYGKVEAAIAFFDRGMIKSSSELLAQVEGEIEQLQAENKRLKELISKSIADFHEQPAVQATGDWQTGMFCGLEDRNITDRYDACMYGHDKALDKVIEWVIAPLEELLKDI